MTEQFIYLFEDAGKLMQVAQLNKIQPSWVHDPAEGLRCDDVEVQRGTTCSKSRAQMLAIILDDWTI